MNADAAPGRSPLVLGSALGLVLGASIMILLHETSHAVAGALQGYRPLQLPFAVDYTPEPTVPAHVRALLAGPVFSLVSGVLGLVVDRVARPFQGRPFWRMAWLWTVFASIQEGLGYLQVTALMPAGDTAQAFTLLGLPPAAFIAASIVGWALLPLTAWVFSVPMREMAATVADRQALATWGWLLGTGALCVLMGLYVLVSPISDPGVIIAVLAGAASIGIYAPMSMMFHSSAADAERAPRMPWPPRGGLLLLGALIGINAVLSLGVLWP